MIHLDTGYLIRAMLRGSPEDKALRSWLRRGERLGMCAVAWAEFLCGPLGPRERELATRIVVERPAFTEADAALAAELCNGSGRRRGSLADCMIAAAAITAQAPLATTNFGDFERFASAGLELRT